MFPVQSFDREKVRWEDYLYELTPVEKRGKIYFKREDYFAPLGYGGINGAKLRQCIWLIGNYARTTSYPTGVMSAASVKSPQLPMCASVAKHYGLECLLVVGATNEASMVKHPNVAIALRAGAKFRIIPVAYNPALQRELGRLHDAFPTHYQLEYGITVSSDDRTVADFHLLGSEQVRNFPQHIETLVMPAGSCNSCVSVLYGIARFRPPNLKRIVLIGIGPNRLEWIRERFRAIERAHGVNVYDLFEPDYVHNPELIGKHKPREPGAYILTHHDLHTTKYVGYQDEMPYHYEGIDFHPTYEGKVMTYLTARKRLFDWFWNDEKTLFWIVGSKPSPEVMNAALAGAA